MTEFDELSRGKQYILLLDRDYEILVRILRTEIRSLYYLMDHYPESYSPIDVARINNEIRVMEQDIQYYSKYTTEKGAENEAILTESTYDSESPKDTFKGPTCTTI